MDFDSSDNMAKLRQLTERLPFVGFSKPEVPAKILIVEDDPESRMLIGDTLKYFGCDCHTSGGGEEALKVINSDKFDILLANIDLTKDATGVKLVENFQRNSPKGSVIIMSGDLDNITKYSKYFATLSIPFGLYELVKKVKNGTEKSK
jgi:DNA-binding NtrC family response regulator